MKFITDAIAQCDEVIRDCKKLNSKELRQFFEKSAQEKKETLEALRKKFN